MKFYKICIIFLILFILSIGAAYAQDSNQAADGALTATDGDVLSDAEGTYTDLETQINTTSDNSIKLEKNYKFNGETDNGKQYLTFSNASFTVEGNAKVIDADGKAGVFKITKNSNVTIRNLLIRNCNSSALMVHDSYLTLENVTFEDNRDGESGSAVYLSRSSMTGNGNRFLNNDAQYGSSIFSSESEITLTNDLFRNDNPVQWAMIYGYKSDIVIENSIFANTTSKYATAIYNDQRTVIKKSKFINLHADITAGAIAVKGASVNTTTSIIDSEFVNTGSAKNGGALFFDIYGDSDGKVTGWVLINNTSFNNCSSEFGAAMIQLGGFAQILNSRFLDNEARENGGAVYVSNVDLLIEKSNFTDNKADADNGLGGAVFFDKGNLTVGNSRFTNNVAAEGRAIYIYDSKYAISSSDFENGGEDIRTYFDKDSSISDCGEISSTVNSTKSEFMLRYGGQSITLNPVIIQASPDDSYFNLKDYNLVTPVKNQGSMGACWAFGAAGAFESAFLKATNITLDISENNIQNMGLRYSIYGNSYFTEAGNYFTSAAYFLSWLGAINAPDDTYDELGKISPLSFSPDAYHIVDAVFVNIKDMKGIKDALIKYGALNIFVYGANSQSSSYSDEYKSVYYDGNGSGNHYVTLVGWNDTFSRNHFSKTAPGDGAWICKNSWGTDWGDEGYFYLSYYDHSLAESDVVGFIIGNDEGYDKMYQIEVGGFEEFNDKYDGYEDVFISDGGNIIAAVGSYFENANSDYTVSVYVDGVLVHTQSGKTAHAGYNTIKLNKLLAVGNNTVFSVRINSDSVPILLNTRQQLLTNNSYVLMNGNLYYLSDSVAPIKVYAYNTYLMTENIVKYNDNREVIFSVDGATENLLVSFEGGNYTVEPVEGKGSVNLGVLNVGDYEVTVHYKGRTFTNHIKVYPTIDTDGVTEITVSYNTKLTIGVKFFDLDGKPLNKTAVSIKFDGKDVPDMNTDEGGSLEIAVYKGNSIAKHYLDIVNPVNGESLRVTVTIVSRFEGNANVAMYYSDGHTFKVRVKDDLGKFVGKGKTVTIKIGKKTFNVKTDAKGYAILKIPDAITPGKYTIFTSFAGQTVKNTLNVKQVLKLGKVKVKKSAKKLVLKATLKQGSKALKSKKLTFKFNGKKFTAKTDKKGIAKVTIKKSVLKKLKVGKKITYQVTYLKNTVKLTAKVKR